MSEDQSTTSNVHEVKNNKPNHDKKFLYMDKFVKHQVADREWKETVHHTFARLNRLQQFSAWADIGIFLVALAALGVALVK